MECKLCNICGHREHLKVPGDIIGGYQYIKNECTGNDDVLKKYPEIYAVHRKHRNHYEAHTFAVLTSKGYVKRYWDKETQSSYTKLHGNIPKIPNFIFNTSFQIKGYNGTIMILTDSMLVCLSNSIIHYPIHIFKKYKYIKFKKLNPNIQKLYMYIVFNLFYTNHNIANMIFKKINLFDILTDINLEQY